MSVENVFQSALLRGCVFIVPSIVVGLIVGLLGSFALTGEIAPYAWLVAPIVGVVIATALVYVVIEAAFLVPRLRYHTEELGFGWLAIAPGVITAMTAMLMASLRIG